MIPHSSFLIPHFLFCEKKKAAASKNETNSNCPRYHSHCAQVRLSQALQSPTQITPRLRAKLNAKSDSLCRLGSHRNPILHYRLTPTAALCEFTIGFLSVLAI